MSDTGPAVAKRVLTEEQIKKLRAEKKRRAILGGAASRISTITSGSIETEREALQEMLRAPEEPASTTTSHEHLPSRNSEHEEHKPLQTQTPPTQTQTQTHSEYIKPQGIDLNPKPTINVSSVSFSHKNFQLLWSIVFSFIFVLYGAWISPLALAVLVHGGIELAMKRNWVEDNSTGDALWWLSTVLALYNYSRSLVKDMCLSLFLSVVFGSVLQGLL